MTFNAIGILLVAIAVLLGIFNLILMIWLIMKLDKITAAQEKQNDILAKLILAMKNADKKILNKIEAQKNLVNRMTVTIADSIDEICNEMGDRYSDIFEQYSNLTDVIGDMNGRMNEFSARIRHLAISMHKDDWTSTDHYYADPEEFKKVIENLRGSGSGGGDAQNVTQADPPLSEVEGMEETDELWDDYAVPHIDWPEEEQAL